MAYLTRRYAGDLALAAEHIGDRRRLSAVELHALGYGDESRDVQHARPLASRSQWLVVGITEGDTPANTPVTQVSLQCVGELVAGLLQCGIRVLREQQMMASGHRVCSNRPPRSTTDAPERRAGLIETRLSFVAMR